MHVSFELDLENNKYKIKPQINFSQSIITVFFCFFKIFYKCYNTVNIFSLLN